MLSGSAGQSRRRTAVAVIRMAARPIASQITCDASRAALEFRDARKRKGRWAIEFELHSRSHHPRFSATRNVKTSSLRLDVSSCSHLRTGIFSDALRIVPRLGAGPSTLTI